MICRYFCKVICYRKIDVLEHIEGKRKQLMRSNVHGLAQYEGLKYKQIGVIHDEIQIECNPNDADYIGMLIVDAMKETTNYYKLNCPITGEYKIGRSWNETH